MKKRLINLEFAVLATLMGNTLEWFDFATFSFLIPIIAKIFSSSENPQTASIQTFFLIALGTFARPIGGFAFGYIGDKYGRKVALISSIILMAISTFSIALLPGYALWGFAAIVLLGIFRFLQGCGASGELPGAMTFLIESSPASSRSFFGSFAFFGVLLGIMLGSLDFFTLTVQLPQEELAAWGWRIPFLIGGCLGTIGLYLRSRLAETRMFQKDREQKMTLFYPLFEIFKEFKVAILQAMAITLLETVSFHILFVFSSIYMIEYFHAEVRQAAGINLFGLIVSLFFIPVAGKLSDKYGRKRVALVISLAFLVLSYPLFQMLSSGPFHLKIVAFALFSILLASYMAPLPAIMGALFPTKVRYTGVSLGYNVTIGFFGGITPFLSYAMIQLTHLLTAPAIFMTICAAVSSIALLSIKSKKNPQTGYD